MKFGRPILAILASFMLIGLLSPAVQADDDKAEVELKVNIVAAPSVTTNDATGISARRATLNGSLTNLGTASSVVVYFEWGATTEDGSMTKPRTMTSTRDFKAHVADLAPDTTYHFRAKAEGDGISYGSELSFTTNPRGRWWNKLFDEIFNRLMHLFRLPW